MAGISSYGSGSATELAAPGDRRVEYGNQLKRHIGTCQSAAMVPTRIFHEGNSGWNIAQSDLDNGWNKGLVPRLRVTCGLSRGKYIHIFVTERMVLIKGAQFNGILNRSDLQAAAADTRTHRPPAKTLADPRISFSTGSRYIRVNSGRQFPHQQIKD